MPRYNASRNQFVPATPGSEGGATIYLANGAITIGDGTHRISKTSAAAMTLAAPTAADDGMRMFLVAGTAFAHTVTVTGGLGGNAADDVITFAKVGDSIEVIADNTKWCPVGAGYGVVIS